MVTRAQGSDSALRTALAFYADRNNWKYQKAADGFIHGRPNANADAGELARNALSTSPLPDTGWLPWTPSTSPVEGQRCQVREPGWKLTGELIDAVYEGHAFAQAGVKGPERFKISVLDWRPLPPAPVTAQAANDNEEKSAAA